MNDCIFCKIINGEIPSYKVYEDDDVFAFMDISPVSAGHVLVIPKKHAQDIFEIDDESHGKVQKVVKKLAHKIVDKLGAKGVNIINNNKAEAGQTVFHYHVHIIPRYDENDKLELKFNPDSAVVIEEVFEKIK